MRLGVLGGTFDPIHMGHLIIAQEAQQQLALQKVLFIPTGEPYLRASQPAANGRTRLAMVQLAIKENPAFEASSMEIDRPGPTYSVETLQALRDQHSPDTELFFILGQDAFMELPSWKSPEMLVSLCTLAVVRRPGAPALEEGGEWSFAGMKANVVLVRAPLIGISATEIRNRAATGLPMRYWVPLVVENFIKVNRLYGAKPDPERRVP